MKMPLVLVNYRAITSESQGYHAMTLYDDVNSMLVYYA